jgi:hypothetical protein
MKLKRTQDRIGEEEEVRQKLVKAFVKRNGRKPRATEGWGIEHDLRKIMLKRRPDYELLAAKGREFKSVEDAVRRLVRGSDQRLWTEVAKRTGIPVMSETGN